MIAKVIAWSLERLAVVEALYGQTRKAARLLGAVAAVRAALGKAETARLITGGRALTLDEAIELADEPAAS